MKKLLLFYGFVFLCGVLLMAQGIEGLVPVGLEFEIINGRSVTITGYTGNAATVNIPAQIQGLPVTTIGDSAFNGHIMLTSITIPSSVTSIGDAAFLNCISLTSIFVPPSVTSIGDAAFQGCMDLTSIIIDNRNPAYTSIDDVLFDKNVRTLIKFPEGKTASAYTIPSSVTSLDIDAIRECRNLTSIIIPSSVTSIDSFAFFSCYSLTSITVDSRNPVYVSIDGVLFNKNIQTIISYPAARSTETFVIPSSVSSIGDGAFSGCSSLTSITIPSSVTSIGDWAFSYSSSLISITLPSSISSISDGTFYDCSSLSSIMIPSTVTSIGDIVFSGCHSLTSIDIPSSVTSIGYRAFARCSNLTSVTLSRRTQVGEGAFPETAQIVYRD